MADDFLGGQCEDFHIGDNTRILAFGNQMESGKDEAANALHIKWNGTVIRTAFGDRLKEIVSAQTGIPIQKFYTHEGKAQKSPFWNSTHRNLLQRTGMMYREHFHPDVWVLCVLEKIQREIKSVRSRFGNDEPILVLITDVRFVNEAERILKWGGELYRIDRPKVIAKRKKREEAGEQIHFSETALDDFEGWTGVLDNNSTLEDFHSLVCETLI